MGERTQIRSADGFAVGAYQAGKNPQVDKAIALQEDIRCFLRQDLSEASSVESARAELWKLVARGASAAGGTDAAAAAADTTPVLQNTNA